MLTSVSGTVPVTIDQTAFDRDGYTIVPKALSPARVDEVLRALPTSLERDGRGGLRNLFDVSAIAEVARDSAIRDIARGILGRGCFAVRALLFDKTPSANWKVAWHQDLTIAVADRREIPGFGPWSAKAGVVHVQPPTAILEQMVAIRVHLDVCREDNGPLRVLPGSHRTGKLAAADVDAWRARNKAVTCLVPPGGLLVMRPPLLHASSPAAVPAHRRVLHFEFAIGELPDGVAWRWQV
jgi:ectoine hydroxylase-related dioxygenase (phytanoyl-CoA dioxygenase family)